MTQGLLAEEKVKELMVVLDWKGLMDQRLLAKLWMTESHLLLMSTPPPTIYLQRLSLSLETEVVDHPHGGNCLWGIA